MLAKTNQILFSQTAQIQHLATLRFEWLGAARDAVDLVALPLQLHHARVAGDAAHRLSAVRRDDLYAGAQVFHGPADTLFGIIDAQLCAGYAELRYTF